ncbi:MAG TPA: LytTR family DNA-binding domain-containing protein [Vicinamibacterales bacterium]|nr:LytTR family DNA-binding domain-containing protein [Vicinamibacterales bacterium]
MTPIRTVIVDDEPLARTSIRTLLQRDPEIQIVAECPSGVEAIDVMRASRPDLCFLDVQMPECDGFDVLETLGADAPAIVVFVTAYDQYALKAFEVEALDYVLKPFDDARFLRVVARAKAQVRPAGGERPPSDRLIVKSSGRVVFLRTSEIDWIEAADYYASLHVGDRTHLLRRSMSVLERELDPAMFCRIHRSAIVNLARVRELCVDANGEHEVVLTVGSRLRLSRSYREELQRRLKTTLNDS